MKKLKQLGALMLALVLAVALCCPAFATEATYSITIKNEAAGHIYEAYQIFAGDLDSTEKVLSNVVWGNGITEAGKTALGNAADKAAELTDENAAVEFAKTVAPYLTNSTASGTQVDGKYVISGLSAGYYLVKDRDNTLQSQDDFYTAYIMKVVKDVTATPKGDKPSVEKKVKDINDSTDTTQSAWQDSADYDIGDTIPFQLTGIVASNYGDYGTYKFIFHDVESNGLTFDADSVKAYVGETLIDSKNYNVVTNPTDGCTFHVEFTNLKNISDVQAGSKINVCYNATLNEKAVIGSTGNPNEVSLEYSNNPNDSQGGDTGKTPRDKVIVFTYKTVVNKIDGDSKKALEGAAFKLEKKLSDGTAKAVEEFTVVEGQTSFKFVGLDDGTYILTETATPSGYNSIKPIEFTINATHDVTSSDPKLTELKVNESGFKTDVSTGVISTDVENNAGSTLPSTGGMGTTVLYVVGGALVVCAGVALVAKKRMQ